MQIYLARNNQQAGPYSIEQLNQMLASQQVLLTDLAWHQGLTEWKALGELTQGKLVYEPIGYVTPTSSNNEQIDRQQNPAITNIKIEKSTKKIIKAAPIGKRISAKLIDFALLFLPQFIAIAYFMPEDAIKVASDGFSVDNQVKIAEMISQSMPAYLNIALMVFVLILLITQCFMITKFGQSIGKKIFKLQIVDVNTNQLPGSLRGFFVRSFLFLILSQVMSVLPLIAIIFIVDLFMFFSKENYALHDRISKTKVIDLSE
ncbi:RDD family protein [Acinetobacter sp. CE-15]|uniref:RDD family protein n=1 Tax=Acinetobacter sp. CE-15 TaxID=3425693 RepID=UPI003DA36F80